MCTQRPSNQHMQHHFEFCSSPAYQAGFIDRVVRSHAVPTGAAHRIQAFARIIKEEREVLGPADNLPAGVFVSQQRPQD
jgi:hypothetical protein